MTSDAYNAEVGDSILDTHLGSGSSRIAAYEMGFDFTGTEIDTEYFEAQEDRFEKHCRQLNFCPFCGERFSWARG